MSRDWTIDDVKVGFELDDRTTATLTDADLNIDQSNTLDPVLDHEHTIPDKDYEGSIAFDLDLEQTVVCNHCGEVNPVYGANVLSTLHIDPCCIACGFPLGMVR